MKSNQIPQTTTTESESVCIQATHANTRNKCPIITYKSANMPKPAKGSRSLSTPKHSTSHDHRQQGISTQRHQTVHSSKPILRTYPQKLQQLLHKWFQYLQRRRHYLLVQFLKDACRAYRIHECRATDRDIPCMFSGLVASCDSYTRQPLHLVRAVLIARDSDCDYKWTKSKAYVHKHVYGILARVCMVASHVELFEASGMPRQHLRAGIAFVNRFLRLL